MYVRFDNVPHVVVYVSSCAAYVRPVDRPSAESVAISIHSDLDALDTLTIGGTTIMPTLKQTEAAIEDFTLRELVRPLAKKLTDMHKAIQSSAIAKDFNEDHDGPRAAFANRLADGVYDAVVTVLEEFDQQPANRATPAATTAKPSGTPAAPTADAQPPTVKRLPSSVAYGPGKTASIMGARIVHVSSSIPTGAIALVANSKAVYTITEADFEKCKKLGLAQTIAEMFPKATAAKVPTKKSARKH
jgi:hypothetical protein